MEAGVATATGESGRGAFLFVGNVLWLDSVNTENAVGGVRRDQLASAADLWAWAAEAGALRDGRVSSAEDGEDLLSRARVLRDSLRDMAGQMARGLSVPEEVVGAINELLALVKPQLVRQEDGWRQEFRAGATGGSAILVAVARSAADTPTEGDARLVRKCEGPTCVLYFCDTSKNHKRRWCSIAGCGNRHKAAEHCRRLRPSHAG